MLSVFSSSSNKFLKCPFYGIRWDIKNGKILQKTENWDDLPQDYQLEAIALAPWEFFEYNNNKFVKHLVSSDEQFEEFYLLPSDEWANTLKQLENITIELNQTKEQLMGFVQNVPIPLLIFSFDETHKILFANNLLLQLGNLPLAKLYQGLKLEDIFGYQASNIINLSKKCKQENTPVQEIFEIHHQNKHTKNYWLVRIFSFKTSFLEGFILGIIDLTHEKEQEFKLHEAYQELQAQAEELAQNQEALEIINTELRKSYEVIEEKNQNLEDSLKSARRYQRKILINLNDIDLLKNHYDCAIKILPHSIIGGDFFFVEDLKNTHPDWLFFTFGDATGHGPSGTLLALTVKLLIKSSLDTIDKLENLHQVLEYSHEELLKIMDATEQLVSVEGAEVILLALPKNPQKIPYFYFSSAGIPIYYYSIASQMKIINQNTKGIGWYLKDAPHKKFFTQKIDFQANDCLFIFTDGLQDQCNEQLTKLGKKRLLNFLQSLDYSPKQTSENQIDSVYHFYNQWKQNYPQMDDILMFSMKFQ